MSESFKINYPSFKRKLISNSPHVFEIPINLENPSSQEIADVWIEKIKNEGITKLAAFKALTDIFSKEEKLTI